MLRKMFAALLISASIRGWAAAPPPDILKTDLMVVVAHPDDEGMVAGVMARYAQGENRVVSCVYCTRGEGGGNEVGTQLGPALGELREAELRKTLGVIGVRHVYFLDKTDWAYTESAAATLEKWGHDDSLDRLVRLVRNLRPEVMVTFLPAPTGGQHGHHQTAGLLATEAFDAAADPQRFPDQIKREGLRPWQVRKLFYVEKTPDSVEVATGGKAADGRTFAQIGAEGESNHRSQGARDDFSRYLAQPRPQYFTLVKTVLQADLPKNDLFAGLPTPQPLLVNVEPETYFYAPGQSGTVHLIVQNNASEPIKNITAGPPSDSANGWTYAMTSGPKSSDALNPKERAELVFSVKAPDNLSLSAEEIPLRFSVKGETAQGQTQLFVETKVKASPLLTAEVVPLPGISRYRDWTRQNRIERFAGVLPSWVPLAAGQPGKVTVRISDHRAGAGTGNARLVAPEGWSVDPDFAELNPGDKELEFELTPPADAPVADVPFRVEVRDSPAPNGPLLAQAEGVAQVTPYTEAARPPRTITVDGDVSDWAGAPEIAISSKNIVQGEFKDDADGSARAQIAYDERFLYVAVRVKDNAVVSNIAPDDIKAHWRTDSVEIDVDPTPRSESTLTTFKMGIFPWDTAGRVRAERDADANQGLIEETAPGTQLASKRTDDGYIIETAIPWASIGAKPEGGKVLGFNILLFDGDEKDARVGDGISKGRLGWSFRPGIWGRAEQWGELKLK